MKSLSSISNFRSQQLMKSSFSTEEIARPDHQGEAGSEMVKMLTQSIVDLSSILAACKDEEANQHARAGKQGMEDLIMEEKQIRHHAVYLKEESTAREKAEKLRTEFVITENAHLKRQLLEAAAETNAMSKSLQEQARILADIKDSKAKAETEAQVLQLQIESMHEDMDAHKYELHLLRKGLQIRNREEEYIKKVADATHKQHLESLKKIAKLDSECQRLRGLICKLRLPGPAAIADQVMRVEATYHVAKKRSPGTKSLPNNYSQDHIRELEALKDKWISMEDETKLLKEALVKRTGELQAARQLCARTVTKLSSAEGLLESMARRPACVPLVNDHHHAIVKSLSVDLQKQVVSSPALPTASIDRAMEVVDWAVGSEDVGINDDELSCAESWASALIAELSHLRNIEDVDKCKPGIILSPELDLQAALQELSSKLSSVADYMLALPSNMKHVMEESNGIEATHLQIGASNAIEATRLQIGVSQIMEKISRMKQLLVEVRKAMEPDRNLHAREVDRSVDELGCSDTSKAKGSVVIDECDAEEAKQSVEGDTGRASTCKKVLTKINEAFNLLLESNYQVDMEGTSTIDQSMLHNADQVMFTVLDGGRVLDSSEEEATEVLGRLVDVLRLHYLEDTSSAAAVLADHSSEASVGETLKSQVDEKLGDSEMALELESLRLEVETLSRTQRSEEIEEKLQAAQAELEQTRGRVKTLEAELCQLRLEVERLSRTQRSEEIDKRVQAAQGELEQSRGRVMKLETELGQLRLDHDKAKLELVHSSGPIDPEQHNNYCTRSQATASHSAACYTIGSCRQPLPPPEDTTEMCLRYSPLHHYVATETEPSAHMSYTSPSVTARMSSPASFDLQLLEHSGKRQIRAAAYGNSGARSLAKSINEAANDGTVAAPILSPAKPTKVATTSRIARFFIRAKNQR